jgi:hypothetical protein
MAVMAPVMPMVVMAMMIVPPRPEVEVEARAVVMAVVPVAWTVQMAAVPVAPVAHLLDGRAVACGGPQIAHGPAGGRGLDRRRQQHEPKDGNRPGERTSVPHSSISFRFGGTHLLLPARRRKRAVEGLAASRVPQRG